ncbi:MAG: porin family protein [Hyphomicrobiales bacterium]|nr:porin family protein [Hyphomicrobiales bacterium]
MRTDTRILGLAAALSLAGTGLATAADIYQPPPAPEPQIPAEAAPPPPFSWAGLYAGVHGGYGWGEANTTFVPDIELDGGFAGGQIGFNWARSNLVLGIEGDISWSGIDGAIGAPAVSHEIDWFGTVRGRAGLAIGRTLPYVTGGIAFAEASRTAGGVATSARHTGYVAGAGIERAVTDRVSAKLEYQYLDFGDKAYVGPDEPDLSAHTVRFGINAHF